MIKNYRILMCYIIINIIVEHLLYTCSFNFHNCYEDRYYDEHFSDRGMEAQRLNFIWVLGI